MAEKIEVQYTKSRLSRRFIAYLADVLVFFMFAVIVFGLSNVIISKTPIVTDNNHQIDVIRNSSGLYIDGVDIITHTTNEKYFHNFTEKKDYLSHAITSFYSNENFFTFEQSKKVNEEYKSRQLAAESDGIKLFVETGGIVSEASVAPEKLYKFYSNEIETRSYSYIVNNSKYISLLKKSFWTSFFEIAFSIIASFSVFYVTLPLTVFKRGRQTLGMKVMGVSLINYHALNVETKKFWLRCLFDFGVFVVLDFFAFFIPLFVSLGMTFFSKTNSSLSNFVFNDYSVDVRNQTIYLDEIERTQKLDSIKEMSIENRDLNLK